ncbi:MAG: hypothetical protein JHC19_07605 [Desulfurococcaceae archaeon]|nr:hypothetical protein [Desulfurococcaceae archaeon]
MIDIGTVLSILTPVLISIISLAYWLGGRFTLSITPKIFIKNFNSYKRYVSNQLIGSHEIF